MQKATPNIGLPHEIREKETIGRPPSKSGHPLTARPQRAQHRRSKARQQQQQQEPQSKRKPTHQTNIGETGFVDRNQRPESKSAADIEDADPEGRAHGVAQKILPQRKEEDHNQSTFLD